MTKRKPLKTRNLIAVDAHFRKAGTMGGTPRQNNRRDRQSVKINLKGE